MALTYEFRANFNDLSPNYCPPINMKDSVKSFMKNIFNEGLADERFPSPNPSHPGGEFACSSPIQKGNLLIHLFPPLYGEGWGGESIYQNSLKTKKMKRFKVKNFNNTT